MHLHNKHIFVKHLTKNNISADRLLSQNLQVHVTKKFIDDDIPAWQSCCTDREEPFVCSTWPAVAVVAWGDAAPSGSFPVVPEVAAAADAGAACSTPWPIRVSLACGCQEIFGSCTLCRTGDTRTWCRGWSNVWEMKKKRFVVIVLLNKIVTVVRPRCLKRRKV